MATKKQSIEQELLEKIAALSAEIQLLKQQPRPIAKKVRGQARPDVYYVLHGVPSQGFPPQAIACARILATAANTNHIPEEEAMKLLESGKQSGRLKTDQESWHIFQYYRAKLIKGDYLRMLTID